MIKNYNGNAPTHVIWGLQKLCEVNAVNMETLMKTFKEKGAVSFYINLDIFGLPDEMSEIKTLNSEEEIREYLKHDFENRLNIFLSRNNINDYLVNSLVEFVRVNNGTFPNDEEMKQLEKAAEEKRLANLSHSTSPITKQPLLREIFELAKQIMELERSKSPTNIISHFEPYWDELKLQTDLLYFNILLDKELDPPQYFCNIRIKDEDVTKSLRLSLNKDGTLNVTHILNSQTDTSLDRFIAIHKEVLSIAKKQGIEFVSEIDYQTLID